MPPESEPTQPAELLPEQKTEPRSARRKQRYAFAACVLLLLLSVGAERVYEYISRGTQIYSSSVPAVSSGIPPITNELQPLVEGTSPVSPAEPAPPSAASPVPVDPFAAVTALSYLVGNVKTGQIYIAHNVNDVMPIASISKLTTALVARQFMNQSQVVPITQQVMDVYSDAYGIEHGEEFTVNELYYPMLLQSNDNIAEAFAYAYGAQVSGVPMSDAASSTDTAFVALMNEYASELGMGHSHFLDASGLSEGNVSTASDLFTLAQFLYADKFSDKSLTPNIFAITTLPSESVATTSDHFSHDFININPFVGNPAFVGGKTGRTNAAGETMLSIFNYQTVVRGQQVTDPIVVIVLHSDYGTRQDDTERLLDIAEAGIATGKY